MKIWWLLLFCNAIFAKEPLAVYLTWQRSPESTMTIQWVAEQKQTRLYFQQAGEEKWKEAEAACTPLPALPQYLIHQVELTSLQPAGEYLFYIDKAVHRFRTMPKSIEAPLTFVVGGDTYPDELPYFKTTCEQAAKTNPAFALIGGDIAYTGGFRSKKMEKTDRWIDWLITWSETMITPDGCHIPVIPAIGNHDVNGHLAFNVDASSFFTLFAFPGKPGYALLDFSDYLSLFILDTEHVNWIFGAQTEWLSTALEKRRDILHKFALYHVPAYPCVRDYRLHQSALVRHFWCPLFAAYGLTAAFEHNDHAYKRTIPMEGGVLYLGDGGWGEKNPRTPKEHWYLAKTAPLRHFIRVTLQPDGSRDFAAIDDTGAVFDAFSR